MKLQQKIKEMAIWVCFYNISVRFTECTGVLDEKYKKISCRKLNTCSVKKRQASWRLSNKNTADKSVLAKIWWYDAYQE